MSDVQPWHPDDRALADLLEFARIEVASGDLEPWAELIGDLYRTGTLTRDEALWVIKLYNCYDSIGSAWQVFMRWPSPEAWSAADDRDDAAQYPCTQERRNLRGGKVLIHLRDYADHLSAGAWRQEEWLRAWMQQDDPEHDYRRLMRRCRLVWGVGRQSAFEWAEFLGKSADFPVHAPDAELWESEGPRRSLQRIYGNPSPDLAWLNRAADHARHHLTANGVDVPWEDFETLICDFNVMRDGRYYPGRHLAALREEIEELADPAHRELLTQSWERIVPADWQHIPPGINKDHLRIYKTTGEIRSHA